MYSILKDGKQIKDLKNKKLKDINLARFLKLNLEIDEKANLERCEPVYAASFAAYLVNGSVYELIKNVDFATSEPTVKEEVKVEEVTEAVEVEATTEAVEVSEASVEVEATQVTEGWQHPYSLEAAEYSEFTPSNDWRYKRMNELVNIAVFQNNAIRWGEIEEYLNLYNKKYKKAQVNVANIKARLAGRLESDWIEIFSILVLGEDIYSTKWLKSNRRELKHKLVK